MVLRVLTVLAVLPTLAAAQSHEWTLETYETDVVRGAVLSASHQRLMVLCGEVLTDETSLYEEVEFSGPGHLNLLGPLRTCPGPWLAQAKCAATTF